MINTFVENQQVSFYALVAEPPKFDTPNRPGAKEYMDLYVSDKTGKIMLKVWDVTESQRNAAVVGAVVHVSGKVTSFNGKMQIKADNVFQAYDAVVEDYIKSAPLAGIKLKDLILGVAAGISNDVLRSITLGVLDKVGDSMISAPAAKSMHHGYYGGLLYHTYRMLEIANFIAKTRPAINKDVLFSGLILHDMAKTVELVHQNGQASGYSLKGRMLGHIPLITMWVERYIVDNGINPECEEVLLLQHLLLSHHGKEEWGSPVKPQVIEAVALHYIDNLDAKLQAAEDALNELPPGKMETDKVYALDGVQLYKHSLTPISEVKNSNSFGGQ